MTRQTDRHRPESAEIRAPNREVLIVRTIDEK